MIDYKTLGSRIRDARIANNLTQEALASLIGCAIDLKQPLNNALYQDFQELSDKEKLFFLDLLKFVKEHDSVCIR